MFAQNQNAFMHRKLLSLNSHLLFSVIKARVQVEAQTLPRFLPRSGVYELTSEGYLSFGKLEEAAEEGDKNQSW